MTGALRFPAAFDFDVEGDVAFEQFCAYGVHDAANPWPELADAEHPEQPFMNPFLRLIYFPTTKPERIVNRFAGRRFRVPDELSIWIGVLHEATHGFLSSTPAKERSRIWLSLALDDVLRLERSNSPEELQRRLATFHDVNDLLTRPFANLELGEELLVTAITFRAVEQMLSERRDRTKALSSLEDLERAWVSKRDPVFQELYFGAPRGETGFRRLASVIDRQLVSRPAVTGVAAFLQPAELVSQRQPWLLARLARERARAIAEIAGKVDSANDVLEFLNERRRRDERLDWSAAVGAQALIIQKKESQTLHALWRITRGRTLRGLSDQPAIGKTATHRYRWGLREPELNFSFAYPAKLPDRWTIGLKVGFPARSYRHDYARLLVLDSLRQQLAARRGFSCPLLVAQRGAKCVCRTALPRTWAVVRALALGGIGDYLGPGGHWSALPRTCQEG